MTDWISLRIHEDFYLNHWVYYLEYTSISENVGEYRQNDCLQLEGDEDVLNSFYNYVLACGYLSAPPSITPENIGYIILPVAPEDASAATPFSTPPASKSNNPRKRSEPCVDAAKDLRPDVYQPIYNFLTKLTENVPHLNGVFARCRVISAMPAFVSPHDGHSRIPTPSPALTQCLLRALTLSMAQGGYLHVPVVALEPWTGAGMVSSGGGGAPAPVGPGPGASPWLTRHSTHATRLAVHLSPLWCVPGEAVVDADADEIEPSVSAAVSAPVLHLRVLARPIIATSTFPSLFSLLLAHELTDLLSPMLTTSDSTSVACASAPSLHSPLPPPPAWSPLPTAVPVIVAGTQRGVATHVRVGVRRVLPGACVCVETDTASDQPKSSDGNGGPPCVNPFALHRHSTGVHDPGSTMRSQANVDAEANGDLSMCIGMSPNAGCGRSECVHSEALAWRMLGSDTIVDSVGIGMGMGAGADAVSRFAGMHTRTLPLDGAVVANPDQLISDVGNTESACIQHPQSMGAAERTWLSWGVKCASVPVMWRAVQHLQNKRHSAALAREHDGYSGFDGDCYAGDSGDTYGEATSAASPLEHGLLGDWEIERRPKVKKNGGVPVSEVDYDARVHVAVRVELQGSDAEEHLPQQVVCVCAGALTGMCEVREGHREAALWRDIAANMHDALEAASTTAGAASTGFGGDDEDTVRVRARVVAEVRDALAALCARVRVARPVEPTAGSTAEAATTTSAGDVAETTKGKGSRRGKTATAPRKRAKKGGAAAAELESVAAEEEGAGAMGAAASPASHANIISACPFTVARNPWMPPPAFTPHVPQSARVTSLALADTSAAFTDTYTASTVAVQRLGGHPAAATFTTARDMYRRTRAPAVTPVELGGDAVAAWRGGGEMNGGLTHGLSGYAMGSGMGGMRSDYGSGFSSAASVNTSYSMYAGNTQTATEHMSSDRSYVHGLAYSQPADFTAGGDPSVTAEEREAVQRAFGFIFCGGGGAVRRVERDGYDGGVWDGEDDLNEEEDEEGEEESIPLSAYAKLVAPRPRSRAIRRGSVLQGSVDGVSGGGARAVAEVEALAFVLFAKRHWHVATAMVTAALDTAISSTSISSDGVSVSTANSVDKTLTSMSGGRAGTVDDIESLTAWLCGGFPAIELGDSVADATLLTAAIDAASGKAGDSCDRGRVCVFLCALWACESHLVRKKYEMLARDVSARMKIMAHAA